MEELLYTASGNSYTEDTDGFCAGIQFTDHNDHTLVTIFSHFNSLDPSRRYAELVYKKHYQFPTGQLIFTDESTIVLQGPDFDVFYTSNYSGASSRLFHYNTIKTLEGLL